MKLLNLDIDNVSIDEAIDRISELVLLGEPSFVVTPNVDHVVRLEGDGRLREAYKKASLVLADGMPLIWIADFFGTPLKEKVSGSDLFPKLCSLAEERGYSMYFLGGGPGIGEKAKENLLEKYPKLNICGVDSPSYGFENNNEEIELVNNRIRVVSPDILIVALGCPKQELYMSNYFKQIAVPVSLGLGASLDFEAGAVQRAPRWMQKAGLEWMYRITQDPKRLIKRYLVDDLKIIKIIFKYKHQRVRK